MSVHWLPPRIRKRPGRAPQKLLQFGHLALAGPGQHRLDPHGIGHDGARGQHVFGQRDDHRAGPPLHGDVEGPRHDLRNAGRIVYLHHPLGRGAEDRRIIHFLEGATPPHAALDLSDEQDEGHRIVLGDVDAMRRIGGPGTARHHADARAIGEAGRGIGHHGGPALVPADRQRDRLSRAARRAPRDRIRPARRTRARHPVSRVGRRGSALRSARCLLSSSSAPLRSPA